MADSSLFVMAVKSTIDKLAYDAAEAVITREVGDTSPKVIDLDNSTNVQELATSKNDHILMRFMYLDESPIDPLWDLEFYIGARTVNDAGNYSLMELVESFRSQVKKGADLVFYDYSGASPSDNRVGWGTVSDCTIEPHIFEGIAGIRLYRVRARCINETVQRAG